MIAEGAEKFQQYHMYCLQYIACICFRNTSGLNTGAPNLLLALAPPNLVTSLFPGYVISIPCTNPLLTPGHLVHAHVAVGF